MSTPERLSAAAFVAVFALAASAVAGEGPNLGRPATAAEIAAWDIDIAPDGEGLPPGSGTPAQGAAIYAKACAGCHGRGGEGGPGGRLVGGRGTIGTASPVRTVGSYWPYATTLFDYIRRAMPYRSPHSLSSDEVYALTAYLLMRNGIICRDRVLDATTLPRIEMPSRDRFRTGSAAN